jgi:hypothetical protein
MQLARARGGALALAVGRVVEHPQVHERVDVSTLPVQIRKGRSEMTYLRGEPTLGIEVKLLGHLARLDAIGAHIDDHVTLLRFECLAS